MGQLMAIRELVCCVLVSLSMMYQIATASEWVGVRQLSAFSQERGQDLSVIVWYPAESGGTPVTLGESPFFVGTDARLEAPIAPGRYPLILLSHGAGLGGTPQAMSWIATALAKQGFLVAAPVHPGNAGADKSAAETMKLWRRPADITATLDAVEKQPLFKDHLEVGKVGALGLSMGGNTVLALAGARLDPLHLASYCDTNELNPSLCGWVKQSGVDLHAMDMRQTGRDNTEPRITFAMVVDPAPVDVFQTISFSRVRIPVAIVNLGAPGAIPKSTLASGIAKAMGNGRYVVIEDGSHYSLFGECKPDASERAMAAKIEDPLCVDGTRRSRSEIHQQLIAMASEAFSHALRTVQ